MQIAIAFDSVMGFSNPDLGRFGKNHLVSHFSTTCSRFSSSCVVVMIKCSQLCSCKHSVVAEMLPLGTIFCEKSMVNFRISSVAEIR